MSVPELVEGPDIYYIAAKDMKVPESFFYARRSLSPFRLSNDPLYYIA
jgi:hypothetical protein